MRDQITAAIRTAMVLVVTSAAAWAVTKLAGYGIDVDPEDVTVIVAAVATVAAAAVVGVVNLALNKLTEKWPVIGKILSLGRTSQTPTY